MKKNESLVNQIQDSVLILVAPAKMLSSPSEVAYKRNPKSKGGTLESCLPSVLGHDKAAGGHVLSIKSETVPWVLSPARRTNPFSWPWHGSRWKREKRAGGNVLFCYCVLGAEEVETRLYFFFVFKTLLCASQAKFLLLHNGEKCFWRDRSSSLLVWYASSVIRLPNCTYDMSFH